jgi:hypothetical protein
MVEVIVFQLLQINIYITQETVIFTIILLLLLLCEFILYSY